MDSVEFLGNILSTSGVTADPNMIEAVNDAHVPIDRTSVQSFLGLEGYYRRFTRNSSGISYPIHATNYTKDKFAWSEHSQAYLDTLKTYLTRAPLLEFTDLESLFIVETDASDSAVDAVLGQKQDGRVNHIKYASRTLNDAELSYSALERESLAVVFALRKFLV